ncbi:cardiolipin synthase [Haliangium ochraceum]|uniref:Cardiolipin synthase n=1 Tax=Haliangium ochraceum (strain DSM 14365 / JCM 11303 / SMP-2) TaxID=502025 RepID=D0LYK7_HALO1|nr:cardiolipin synthase [Haliangium ochraceum]ACY17873.1 phospholipase D/Transphosphatidylase [Haliangium ochraceum DSM 14365]
MSVLHTLIGLVVLAFGVVTAVHALLNKRDPRSSFGWTVMCLFVPPFGAMAYWLFGVNRIVSKAQRWQEHGRFQPGNERAYSEAEAELASQHPQRAETMSALLRISHRVTGRPLLRGNTVEPLFNGENAYPAMLEAIEGAQRSVYLSTYIFDSDAAGLRFLDALSAAAARGVDVRVIVDAIGELYARPRITRLLRRRPGIRVERFLPLTQGLRINLRNHRKVLVVDSALGFTGGMNIGRRHLVEDADNERPTADLHFRIRGPAVYALEDVFFEDWYFCTGEEPAWQHSDYPVEHLGPAMCRAISDGPNHDFEVLTWILVGALSTARERVQIMTPYFLPSRELLASLHAAALRGVAVDIILPAENNLPFVGWAVQSMLDEVMYYGVRVYYQPPPFNHSKLFVVDEFYVVLGSANLDPRSLRLNFEFNLEVYDAALASTLAAHFNTVRGHSREVSVDELRARSLPVRLRDSVAKLMSPYL